ncbi:MAG: c-type cytochrome [Gemmatimonadaceae bacterium]|nr:c-type cytochrome [Gemmatimonadaceae bacterium]
MRRACAVLVPVALLLSACGDRGDRAGDTTAAGGASESPSAESRPPAASNLDPSTITETELALGDSVYHGLIGATSCQSCHGADGSQANVAPNLTDAEWLHSDGSFEGIYRTIETGVMTPKQYTSIMPPYGGAPLDPVKHRAVAAYVYRLSHK